jgi:hypothetical protein
MVFPDRNRAIADAFDDIRAAVNPKLIILILKVFNINPGLLLAAEKEK